MDSHVEEYVSLIGDFGRNFFESFERGRSRGISCSDRILVCGMGGSGISGDYLKSVLDRSTSAEVVVSKGYVPPSYVDDGWTVFAISYSGNTEETLSQVQMLLDRGLKVHAITSGGRLQGLSGDVDVHVVAGGFQPRAAFPMLFGYLFGLVYDRFKIPLGELESRLSDYCGVLIDGYGSLKADFSGFKDCIPFILTSSSLSCVGTRFRCQLNENSKLHAASFESPEFSHNGIVGLDGDFPSALKFLVLRSGFEDSRTSHHLDFVVDRLGGRAISIEAESGSYLYSLLSLTAKLDLVSVALADLRSVDPYAIPSINSLKSYLRQAS